MGIAPETSCNLSLESLSYHIAGAQYLISHGQHGGTICWELSKVTLKISQVSMLIDSIKKSSGREQESLLGEGSPLFVSELRMLSRHHGLQP